MSDSWRGIDFGAIMEAVNKCIPKSILKAVIKEWRVYDDGDSGYILWTNGYCEQWGKIIGTSSGYAEVTFLKPFATSKYCLLMQLRWNNNDTSGIGGYGDVVGQTPDYDYGQAPTGFRCSIDAYQFNWKASGFVNVN